MERSEIPHQHESQPVVRGAEVRVGSQHFVVRSPRSSRCAVAQPVVPQGVLKKRQLAVQLPRMAVQPDDACCRREHHRELGKEEKEQRSIHS